MTVARQPVLFVGHGSPLNAVADNDIRRGWVEMGGRLGKPRAIVAVSAHWYTRGRFVRNTETNPKIDDMRGFPEILYEIEYEPAGDPALAARVIELMGDDRVTATPEWGIDHGIWSVLCNMYPDADIPVVMLSTDAAASPQEHLDLGRRIASLRDEGVMILASGNIVHNLRAVNWEMDTGYPWARDFDTRVKEAVLSREFGTVVDYQAIDGWYDSIPTPDHFLPLLTALGAVSDDDDIEAWNEIIELGTMSQTSFLFR